MNDLFLNDAATPVAGSGQDLSDTTTGGDHTVTVVAGATYAFTCGSVASSDYLFGVATILTAANVIWTCPVSTTCIIRVPDDITTLHYESSASGGKGWLRRLSMP